jgi:hypothetical protein
VFSFEPPLEGYSSVDRALIAAAVAVFALDVAAKLWHFVDPRRQTLQDRAFSLLVVEDLASTAPDPSPWSGLWRRGP